MNNLFYNTTNETGTALKACRRAVNKQEKEVLDIFRTYDTENPPSSVHKLLPQYPITSIRRAITNLTNAGYLRKTHVKIMSPWNRREHCWELRGE